jgi:hypothetical protein
MVLGMYFQKINPLQPAVFEKIFFKFCAPKILEKTTFEVISLTRQLQYFKASFGSFLFQNLDLNSKKFFKKKSFHELLQLKKLRKSALNVSFTHISKNFQTPFLNQKLRQSAGVGPLHYICRK